MPPSSRIEWPVMPSASLEPRDTARMSVSTVSTKSVQIHEVYDALRARLLRAFVCRSAPKGIPAPPFRARTVRDPASMI
jgi:hypothetical protein